MDSEMLTATPKQPEAPKRLGGCTGKGFMPGASGNPNGQSELDAIVCSLAQHLTAKNLLRLDSIANDERTPKRLQVKCIDIIERARRAPRRSRCPEHDAAEVAA
jgi:hypothetical protein